MQEDRAGVGWNVGPPVHTTRVAFNVRCLSWQWPIANCFYRISPGAQRSSCFHADREGPDRVGVVQDQIQDVVARVSGEGTLFFQSQSGGWTSQEHKLGFGLWSNCVVRLGTESERTRIWGHRQEDANRYPWWQKMTWQYRSESWEASAVSGAWVSPYLPTEDVIQDLSHNHYRYPFKFNLISGSVIFWRIIV